MTHYVFKSLEEMQQSEIDSQIGDTFFIWKDKIEKGDTMSHYAEQWEGTKCDRNKPYREQPTNNPVSSPNHYLKLDYECIEIIASSLSKEAFRGYCMGNFLKYRFRMGDKDELMQDFNKSKEYLMLFDKYYHLCKDVPF